MIELWMNSSDNNSDMQELLRVNSQANEDDRIKSFIMPVILSVSSQGHEDNGTMW